jgi:hypothetical protein
MARALTISCDRCGCVRPADRRPPTWWVLEQQSEVLTTGALDFCSLPCLALWLADSRVRTHPAYAADFAAEGK